MSVRPRLIWVTIVLILFLAGGLLVMLRTWVIQGVVLPVRIVEGSMAPSLLGDHYRLDCPSCGMPFACDASGFVIGDDATCPQCRSVFQPSRLVPQRGDRVCIHRWKKGSRIRRWQMVAMNANDRSRRLVKRVAGLPGETVDLQAGDVFINGKRATKSLAQLKSLSIVVSAEFDRRHSPTQPSAWSSTDEAWQATPQGWRFRHLEAGETKWLRFSPAIDADPDRPFSILDDYGYNQRISRRLNTVRDLLVQCEFVPRDVDNFVVRFQDSRNEWKVTWNIRQRWASATCGPQTLTVRRLVVPHSPHLCRLDAGLFDGQLVMALNGVTVLRWQDNQLAASSEPATPEVSVGANRGFTVVRRLVVSRDIYYLGADDNPTFKLPQRLEANEFFVLGDNSPISRDTREIGPVSARDLLGTVTPLARSAGER